MRIEVRKPRRHNAPGVHQREGAEMNATHEDGLGVVFDGDPRGTTVKVRVPSGKTDDWGQTGICVP